MVSPEKWRSNIGYIWAMIGSAVGFGPILSFSARCYFNGGGAFLIPLAIAVMVLGFPLLVLEGVIGQEFQLPLVSAYGRIAGKWGKFFGWLAVLGVLSIGSYYCVITAWTMAYIFYASADMIPTDTATFFTQYFLKDSGALTTIGTISMPIVISIIMVSLCTWFVMVQNIKKGVEKFCSIFLPILFVLLIGLLVFIGSLPGAWNGFAYFLTPEFSQLRNPEIWLAAFGHVFFSLSIALAIIVGYSRYTDKSVNIAHSMLWVVIAEICTSIIAGLVIFGGIGHMAYIQGIPFAHVISSSLFGLGFIVFPKVIVMFPYLVRVVVGAVFFFCVFIAGITGLFSIVEAVAGNCEVEFSWNRRKAISIITALIFCMALLYSGGNGTSIIDALDVMVSGFNVVFAGLVEIIVFMYFSSQVISHPAWFSHPHKRAWRYYALKYIAPIVLLIILGSSLVAEFRADFTLVQYIRWGWLIIAAISAMICARKKP
jgi:neurotransmitter:Na+ symporter, NSS family